LLDGFFAAKAIFQPFPLERTSHTRVSERFCRIMVTVYRPLPQELLTVGVVGILLYSLVFFCAVTSLWRPAQNWTVKLFFALLLVMAALEIPRYAEIAVTSSYVSQPSYALHILAGSVFFGAFGIVCYQWGKLLEIGGSFMSRAVLSVKSLFVAVGVFTVVDIIAVGLCVSAPDLRTFFDSPSFVSITVVEAVKNLVYSTLLMGSGIRLVRKLWHYSNDERQHTTLWAVVKNSVLWSGSEHGHSAPLAQHSCEEEETKELDIEADVVPQHAPASADPDQGTMLLSAVVRITWVLALTSVCFALRISMMVVKIVALYTDAPVTTRSFTLFGFAWMLLADFIPRVVPSLFLILLMRNKRTIAQDQATAASSGTALHATIRSPTHHFHGRAGVVSPRGRELVVLHSRASELSDVSLD
jgi:hypothetical protein